MKGLVLLAFALTIAGGDVALAQSPAPDIPVADAARLFAEAHTLCTDDAGKLWGVSLCVPMMFADPKTRRAVANTALPGATRDGSVFRLTLPAKAMIANAPTAYDGVHVAELVWPMTGSADARAVTLMHESFGR